MARITGSFCAGLAYSSGNHYTPPAPQFGNLFRDVRLHRRRKLVREIGDAQHVTPRKEKRFLYFVTNSLVPICPHAKPVCSAARRRCPASIPAIVKRSPFTNW